MRRLNQLFLFACSAIAIQQANADEVVASGMYSSASHCEWTTEFESSIYLVRNLDCDSVSAATAIRYRTATIPTPLFGCAMSANHPSFYVNPTSQAPSPSSSCHFTVYETD